MNRAPTNVIVIALMLILVVGIVTSSSSYFLNISEAKKSSTKKNDSNKHSNGFSSQATQSFTGCHIVNFHDLSCESDTVVFTGCDTGTTQVGSEFHLVCDNSLVDPPTDNLFECEENPDVVETTCDLGPERVSDPCDDHPGSTCFPRCAFDEEVGVGTLLCDSGENTGSTFEFTFENCVADAGADFDDIGGIITCPVEGGSNVFECSWLVSADPTDECALISSPDSTPGEPGSEGGTRASNDNGLAISSDSLGDEENNNNNVINVG